MKHFGRVPVGESASSIIRAVSVGKDTYVMIPGKRKEEEWLLPRQVRKRSILMTWLLERVGSVQGPNPWRGA
jgi:hypothetical protein